MSKQYAASRGIGVSGWAFLILLGLKAGGVEPAADWSWWWITAPLWIPAVAFAAFMLCLGAVLLVLTLAVWVERRVNRRRAAKRRAARRGYLK